MGVVTYLPRLAADLTPYFAATLVIAAAAGVVLIVLPRLEPRMRRRMVSIIVAADVLLALADAGYALPAKTTLARENPTTVALAKLLGPQGRYAVFNPAQALPARYKTVIHEIGTYDLPILHQIESVQGYGSAVAGRYADATGSHEVENLQPAALTRPNLDILNLRELVTLPEYLVAAIPGNQPIPLATGTPVPPGTSPEAEALNAIAPLKPLRALPPTLLLRGRSSTWMLPGPLALDSVTVVLIPYRRRLPGSLAVGILDARDQIASDRQVQVVDSRAQMALTGRVAYGIQVGAPGGASIAIAAVAVSTRQPTAVNSGPSTHRLVLNQVLQGVLEPPRWRYQTEIGGLPVFTDTIARGATWLERARVRDAACAARPLSPREHAYRPAMAEPGDRLFDAPTGRARPERRLRVRVAREPGADRRRSAGDRAGPAARARPSDLGPGRQLHRDVDLYLQARNPRAPRLRGEHDRSGSACSRPEATPQVQGRQDACPIRARNCG